MFASFDGSRPNLAVVEPGQDAEDAAGAGIFEQIRMSLSRQRQPHNPVLELKALWMQSGGYDWDLCDAEALEKLSASPEARSIYMSSGNWLSVEDNFVVQSSEHDSGLRAIQVTSEAPEWTPANMIYHIYTIFPDT